MRVLSFLLAAAALLIFCSQTFANSSPVVSNVTASQRSDDSKLVDIYYDLADADGDNCTVWAFVSDDNGASWRVPAWAFSGDVGSGVGPGNKHIIWDAATDIPGKIGDFKVRVYADDGNGTAPKVLVSGGSFPYDNTGDPDEWVHVDSFLIDKHEVTIQFYCQFLNDTNDDGSRWDEHQEIIRTGSIGNYLYTVEEGKENHPVQYVSYVDAEAFCVWRSSLENMTYRLPTQQQWQKAAAWDPVEQHFYFYGFHADSIDCSYCNYSNCVGRTTEVGRYNGTEGRQNAKSYYGCYDMSGNVSEYVKPDRRRGGCYTNPDSYVLTTFSDVINTGSREHATGFRCVMVPDGQ